MKAAVLLLPLLFVQSDTADLEYKLELGKEIKALQEKADKLAAEKGVTDADRLVPVLRPKRHLWMHDSRRGFFERLNNGYWIEKVGDGEAKIFAASAKNARFVELIFTGNGGGTRVRLYNDRCDVKHRKDRIFKKTYKGGWEL